VEPIGSTTGRITAGGAGGGTAVSLGTPFPSHLTLGNVRRPGGTPAKKSCLQSCLPLRLCTLPKTRHVPPQPSPSLPLYLPT